MRIFASSWLKNTRNAANSRHRVTAEVFPDCRDGSKVAILQLERLAGREEPEVLRIELDFEAAVALQCDLKKITRCD